MRQPAIIAYAQAGFGDVYLPFKNMTGLWKRTRHRPNSLTGQKINGWKFTNLVKEGRVFLPATKSDQALKLASPS